MNRRQFTLAVLTSSSAGLLGASAVRVAAAQAESINELYSRSIVVDSLCAPFADIEAPSAASLAAVQRSGITAINFTVSAPDFDETIFNLGVVYKLADHHSDVFLIVRRLADLGRAKAEHRLGLILGFQNIEVMEQDPERIPTFRNLGVRIMQLTYNRRGKFGDGCLEPSDGGLRPAGRDAIRLMNDSGVAVDLSHSGYRTTADGIAHSDKPVLISHGGCAAVSAHPRNTPDDILKPLANRGGYFGIYLVPYLVASPTIPTREHVLNHLLHAINICGTDHVGIGSDGGIPTVVLTPEAQAMFERTMAHRKTAGVAAPGEDRYPYVPDLNGPDHMQVIADELAKRGQPVATIEKVLGANFQRIIGEIWSSA